jgi:two-component system NtrC family response regulator
MPRVLVVDDDDSFREVMQFHLEEEGIDADTAPDGQAALAAFDPSVHAVVVTDLKMPRLDGMELLRRLKARDAATVVVVITAFGDIETAVEAMKAGAFDFLPKPCGKDHFKMVVKKALTHRGLATRVQELEHLVSTGGRDLIFASARMREVVALIDRVGPSPATILLAGESGVGKELLAQRLHRKSPRIQGPFVAVNCAALPKDLMESELFGHAKGAFTGAARDRRGKFELAHGGTLLLDEVAELPPELQSKLLRALSERVIDVVGKEQPVPIDVRVVAATNQDLARSVADGRFRADLYYRLNVVTVVVPPLRERPEDVRMLAAHFLRQFAPDRELSFDDAAWQRLLAHAWPGNVRELENVCQHVALLAETDEITADMLPLTPAAVPSMTPASAAGPAIQLPPEGIRLADLEKNVIEEALRLNNYNQTKTARFLGIARHVLLYRLQKFGIRLPSRGAIER